MIYSPYSPENISETEEPSAKKSVEDERQKSLEKNKSSPEPQTTKVSISNQLNKRLSKPESLTAGLDYEVGM